MPDGVVRVVVTAATFGVTLLASTTTVVLVNQFSGGTTATGTVTAGAGVVAGQVITVVYDAANSTYTAPLVLVPDGVTAAFQSSGPAGSQSLAAGFEAALPHSCATR